MTIICFGDSNTYGFDPRGFFGGRYDDPWPELLGRKLRHTAINWGENGREIPVRTLTVPPDTDLLIVMLGTNDLLQGASAEAVNRKMERFLQSLELERRKILLIAPPPMRPGAWVTDQRLIDGSAALAGCYGNIAAEMGIRFADAGRWEIPMTYDGVHFTAEGHALFGAKVAAILE